MCTTKKTESKEIAEEVMAAMLDALHSTRSSARSMGVLSQLLSQVYPGGGLDVECDKLTNTIVDCLVCLVVIARKTCNAK